MKCMRAQIIFAMEALRSYSGEESASEEDKKERKEKNNQPDDDKQVGFNITLKGQRS